jgi:pyruvyl transferase EpsO
VSFWAVCLLHLLATVATNASIGWGSVALAHVVKALEPLTAVALAWLIGADREGWLGWPRYLACLVPMAAGVALFSFSTSASRADSHATSLAVLLALASNLCFCVRNLILKKLNAKVVIASSSSPPATQSPASVNTQSSSSSSKSPGGESSMDLFLNTSLAGCLLTAPVMLLVENGPSLYQFWAEATTNWEMAAQVVGSGLCYYAYNSASFALLGWLSVITHSALNVLKRVVIIVLAIIWSRYLHPTCTRPRSSPVTNLVRRVCRVSRYVMVCTSRSCVDLMGALGIAMTVAGAAAYHHFRTAGHGGSGHVTLSKVGSLGWLKVSVLVILVATLACLAMGSHPLLISPATGGARTFSSAVANPAQSEALQRALSMNLIEREFRRHGCLAALQERIMTSLLSLVPPRSPVVLVGIPRHRNLGDLFIAYGEMLFLAQTSLVPSLVIDDEEPLPSQVPEGTVFFTHGGGNIGDLWLGPSKQRESLIRAFPDHKVIVFPQSVYYADKTKERDSLAWLATFPNLHVCVRDMPSYSTLIAGGLSEANVHLVPDMAFMIGSLTPLYAHAPFNVSLLARTDKEKASDGLVRYASKQARHHSGVFMHDWKEAKSLGAGNVQAEALNHSPEWRVMLLTGRGNKAITAGRMFVSDRLHGMIMALLTGRPHFFHDNSYKKVSALRNTWLLGDRIPECRPEYFFSIPGTTFDTSIDIALELIQAGLV